jgi:hypothetical protein
MLAPTRRTDVSQTDAGAEQVRLSISTSFAKKNLCS